MVKPPLIRKRPYPATCKSTITLVIHTEFPSNSQPLFPKLRYHTADLVYERNKVHVKTDIHRHFGQAPLYKAHPVPPLAPPASRLPLLRTLQCCKTRTTKKSDRRNPSMPVLPVMVSLASGHAARAG